MNYEIRVKNVNNKRITKEVRQFFGDSLRGHRKRGDDVDFTSQFVRDSICFALMLFFDTYAPNNNIVQYDAYSNKRNNDVSWTKRGLFVFTIKFKLQNCFNTTELNFYIRNDDQEIVIPEPKKETKLF